MLEGSAYAFSFSLLVQNGGWTLFLSSDDLSICHVFSSAFILAEFTKWFLSSLETISNEISNDVVELTVCFRMTVHSHMSER